MTANTSQPIDRYLRLKQVLDIVPIGRATLYDWMERGTFPGSHDLGGGIVARRQSDIERWFEERPVTVRDVA